MVLPRLLTTSALVISCVAAHAAAATVGDVSTSGGASIVKAVVAFHFTSFAVMMQYCDCCCLCCSVMLLFLVLMLTLIVSVIQIQIRKL